MIGFTLSSCSSEELVKKDIIVEDCIRIPKQDGELKILYYGKDEETGESYDLILDLVLECIKGVNDFELLPYIRINLLDENDVQLIYVRENIDENFLKSKGNKSHFEFGLTLEHDTKSKRELEKIKKNTKKITIQSDIVKTEEEKKKEEEERRKMEEEERIKKETELQIAVLKGLFGL